MHQNCAHAIVSLLFPVIDNDPAFGTQLTASAPVTLSSVQSKGRAPLMQAFLTVAAPVVRATVPAQRMPPLAAVSSTNCPVLFTDAGVNGEVDCPVSLKT